MALDLLCQHFGIERSNGSSLQSGFLFCIAFMTIDLTSLLNRDRIKTDIYQWWKNRLAPGLNLPSLIRVLNETLCMPKQLCCDRPTSPNLPPIPLLPLAQNLGSNRNLVTQGSSALP